MRVAEAAKDKGIERFTFASSCAVIGFHVDQVADEDYPANPQSEYAQSKLDAEKGLKSLTDNKFCPVILRQATVFGFSPRMRYDLVVNTMTRDAYQKGEIFVYSAGEMWRPLVEVKDVARAHILCAAAPKEKVGGQTFNVVHMNYRVLELAHWIKDVLKGLKAAKVEVLFGTKEIRSYRVSGEKIKKVLGFVPGVTVKDSTLEIFNVLRSGRYTDFSNPIYYNIDWMKLLSSMEGRLKVIGRVF
jgi:nucleoside-diphosphate-sugar epimerase